MPLILNDTQPGGLHPLFAGILAAHSAVPAQAQRAEYLTLLRTMDWRHEFGDWQAHQAGLRQIRRIRALQPYVDADRALFNAHRPDVHGAPTL
jgi:hypothetical protein